MYSSGSVPVLLQAALQGPVGTQLALHATGTQSLLLVHSLIKRVSPCLAGHSVPFLAAGVVIMYLRSHPAMKSFSKLGASGLQVLVDCLLRAHPRKQSLAI